MKLRRISSILVLALLFPLVSIQTAQAGIQTLKYCGISFNRDYPVSDTSFTYEVKYALGYDASIAFATTANNVQYPNAAGGVMTSPHSTLLGSADTANGLEIYYNTNYLPNGELLIFLGRANNILQFKNPAWQFPEFTQAQGSSPYIHIAVVRDSSRRTSVFFNGVAATQSGKNFDNYTNVSYQTDNNNYTNVRYFGTSGLYTSDVNPKTYLSNLRLVTGAALYDATAANISIPSTADLRLNAASGTTQVLLNSMTPAGILTNSSNVNSTAATLYNFGGGSQAQIDAGEACAADASKAYIGGDGVYNVYFADGNTASDSGTLPARQYFDSSATTPDPITVPANSMTKAGNWSFAGWNTLANGTGTTYLPGSTFVPTGNSTLYTKWVAAYTVTYANGGGSGTLPTQSPVANGGTFTVASNTLTKANSLFTGWSDGSSTYAAGSTYTMGSANKTLTAQWVTGYKATYNSNSATSGTVPATQEYASPGGTALTISSNTGNLVRTGYTFAGWATAANGTGTTYTEGQTGVTLSADTILYAKWTPNTYTATYDENNATSGTVPASQNYTTAGTALTLPGNSGTLARTGYTFAGWNTNAAGTGTSYSASQSGVTIAANTTLYARWTANSNVVTYNSQGGSLVSNGAFTTGSTLTLAAAPTRAGYNFAGWFAEATGGTALVSGFSPTETAPITVYAQWTANTYTVTYNANGATSGTVASGQSYTSGETALTLDNNSGILERTGYTFSGWNTLANGLGTNYASGAVSQTFTTNTILYAKWTGTTYSATYDSNSATSGTAPASQNYTTGGAAITLATNSGTLARIGYTFAGWNTAVDGSGANYAAGATSQTLSASTTLYAKWTANTYTVTYNGNSSTSGTVPASQSYTSGETALTIDNNSGTLARTGYTFAGWNTLANGLGTNYAAGATSQTFVATTTLFALWTGNTYTATYDSNSATSGTVPTSQSYTSGGATLTLPGNSGTLVRTGYTFSGWNTAADGSGTSYTATQSGVAITNNVMLYARWLGDTYTITYNANGSTSGSAPSTQSYTSGGSPLTLATNSGSLLKTGYFFAGWNTLSDGTGTDYAGGATGQMFGANVTLYAKWTVTPNSTVTFKANFGSVSDVSQSTNVDTNLISNSFTYPGYNFAGWNTLANGTGTFYANNASYNFAANLTLFAKWTAKSTRTLTFAVTALSINLGDTATATAALSTGSGTVTYSAGSSTACTVNAVTGLITVTSGVGTCSISASVPEDETYQVVTSAAAFVVTVGFNIPAIPIIANVTASANTMLLTVTQSDLNTNGINNYKYSLDGITYVSIGSVASPLSISGLTPGIYSVRLKAVNPAGESAPSAALTVIVIAGPSVMVNVPSVAPAPAPAPAPSGPSPAEIQAAIDKAYAEREAADKLAAEKAAAEKAIADKLAAEKAAAEKAAADKLAAEKAAAEKAEAERIAAEKLAAEKAAADKLAADKAAAEKAAAEKAEAERIAAEKAAAEKAAAEKLAAEKAAEEKAAADKLAAEKAEAERIAADKLAADKAATEKAAADKLAAEKAAAEKAESEKIAAEKAAAEKLAADKLAAEQLAAEKALATKLAEEKAAAEKLAACILGKTSTLVTSKSKTMRIYNQICFMPQMLKPIDKDIAEINRVISLIKSKKIKSITLLSFADEKIGVDFKAVAKAQAAMVSGMIKKAIPNLKVSYKLYGSSAKKNVVSQGRVVITAN